LTVNQLNSLSALFRRLLTGTLDAHRSRLGVATAGELAVQQLLRTTGVEASTGSFGATAIGGNLTGQQARFQRAEGDRFNGSRFEGADFHISGTSENEIFHDINVLDGKLYNCMEVTEYCLPKAPLISQTTCPGCRLQQESGNFSAQASATVGRCQHGCDYRWQLGDLSGACSAGDVSKGGTKRVSCPVSGALEPGERRRTFIDLVAANRLDTRKTTTHRFAVDWEREQQQDPFGGAFSVGYECAVSGLSVVGNVYCLTNKQKPGAGLAAASIRLFIENAPYPESEYRAASSYTTFGQAGSCNITVNTWDGTVTSYQRYPSCGFRMTLEVTHTPSGKSVTLTNGGFSGFNMWGAELVSGGGGLGL